MTFFRVLAVTGLAVPVSAFVLHPSGSHSLRPLLSPRHRSQSLRPSPFFDVETAEDFDDSLFTRLLSERTKEVEPEKTAAELLEEVRKLREEVGEYDAQKAKEIAEKEAEKALQEQIISPPKYASDVLTPQQMKDSDEPAAGPQEMKELLQRTNFKNQTDCVLALVELKRRRAAKLWGSIGSKNIGWELTTQQAFEQKLNVNLKDIQFGNDEEVYKWAVFWSLMFATVAAPSALNFVGGNTGAFLGYLICFVPLTTLFLGAADANLLNRLWINLQDKLDKDFSERRVYHEAAHFVVGYLFGFIPASASASEETSQIEFWPKRPKISQDGSVQTKIRMIFDEEEAEAFALLSMAGVAGEVLKFKRSTGGANDLLSLSYVLSNSVEPKLMDTKKVNLPVWASLEAWKIASRFPKELDAVADVLRKKGGVKEAILALEFAELYSEEKQRKEA
uniref:Peptidase M41 domain-containing protein n=1 Tax=Chromera velia CCMP2878 TaxID=1169474 RepID=A0A0G4HUQ1_9ALVE|eukprot:Cvel_8694.t1-p1 / transcript=Cvel_8694.t1 / gene=Cvel_8694 / organism=Chromera_velia_CCMP2878 / gene_product=hypothetical protein / transcript_product=hypothetical protein / location=Cvel_scaffold485:30296-34939(+) / protein_length=448 / sequence_SO=supercontig / SO=protein_coding / is_pseudo=false